LEHFFYFLLFRKQVLLSVSSITITTYYDMLNEVFFPLFITA